MSNGDEWAKQISGGGSIVGTLNKGGWVNKPEGWQNEGVGVEECIPGCLNVIGQHKIWMGWEK